MFGPMQTFTLRQSAVVNAQCDAENTEGQWKLSPKNKQTNGWPLIFHVFQRVQ